MCKNNSALNYAKSKKNDEFYIRMMDVIRELRFYKDFFRNKIVFCNCNDALHTTFVEFFINNFELLGIKELIYSSYGEGDDNGIIFMYDGVITYSEELDGKGDFRYGKCLDALIYADVVVTGPPFSLFREFISLMFRYNKKFLVVGDLNSIACKTIFPYIIEGKMWLGINKCIKFIVPDNYNKAYKIENGEKLATIGTSVWFTNIPHGVTNKQLKLTSKFEKSKYHRCDNFDAIFVEKVKQIPKYYRGVMAVPITFLLDYCPQQFEILGITDTSEYSREYRIDGFYDYGRAYVDGKKKYPHLLIRRKDLLHK